MKKFAVVVAVMVGLVACGQEKKEAPESQPTKNSKVQEAQAGEKKKGLDAFLNGGPRSTKIVDPQDVEK
jgi:hypothetical protein